MRRVDDVKEEVRVLGLLERRLEGRDEVVREVPDEAYSVRQQHPPAAREVPRARASVEGREELVLDEDAGIRERVHERRLAGVGVADDAHGKLIRAGPYFLDLLLLYVQEALLQFADALADDSPVGLQLLLARPARADTAAVALQVRPHLLKARQRVLELRELHLHLGRGSARVRREDVEDDLAAVDYFGVDYLFQVPELRGAQVMVEDDDVGVERLRPCRVSGAPCLCR